MKKILILGGANSQVPAIKKAKELGYYVVTCDYLPDNPGHRFSDEYVNVSTVDKEKILEISKAKEINGIVAYASDPSAETAAYVIDKMKLSGAGIKSTKILAEKDTFRKFQKNNGFDYPDFISISEYDDFNKFADNIPLPCMVKPVDSSGSKGVSRVDKKADLYEAYDCAMRFSRKKRVIFEEYIDSAYNQLHGDGFVYNNKLIFLELGDQRFYNCVPIGSSCPSIVGRDIQILAWKMVNRLLKKIEFNSGGINVEIRLGNNGKLYIIEIGPRTGGNYIPQLMEVSTGFEEMTAVLKMAMGDYVPQEFRRTKTQYSFQYIIGAKVCGIFKQLWVSPFIDNNIKELYIHKKPGDKVYEYKNSSGVIGVAILIFDTRLQMEKVINHIEDYFKVFIEKEV